MYSFFYSANLDKKNSKKLRLVENALSNLGIKDRINKITPLTKIGDLVNKEARLGVKTFVVIGSNNLLYNFLDLLAEKNLCLGYIPFDSDSVLCKVFSISSTQSACELLAARRIVKIDLGLINNKNYFFDNITFNGSELLLKYDKFDLYIKKKCQLIITNSLWKVKKNIYFEAGSREGILETYVFNKENKFYNLHNNSLKNLLVKITTKKVAIAGHSSNFSFLIDNKKVSGGISDIRIIEKAINIVVGKGRAD